MKRTSLLYSPKRRQEGNLGLSALIATSILALALCVWLFFPLIRPTKPILRIGMNPWPPGELLPLAHTRGFFADEGLDVQIVEFNSLSDSRRAYETGKIDGMAATLVEVLIGGENRGAPARIVRAINISNGADIIATTRDRPHVSALRGGRIGVEPGSVGLFLLARALESAGLTLSDVTLVALNQMGMAERLLHGELDAVVTHPPESIPLLKHPNIHIVFDSSRIPGEVVDVYAFAPEVIKSHPQAIAAFHRAMDRAFAFYETHSADALAFMARRHRLSPSEFQATLTNGISLVPPTRQKDLLAPGGPVATAQDRVARLLRQEGLLGPTTLTDQPLPR